MLDELRRLRIEQALTPSQGIEWCKVYFAEHGLDEKQMPTKQQIKSVMKVFDFVMNNSLLNILFIQSCPQHSIIF
jgi:hypothetical protein